MKLDIRYALCVSFSTRQAVWYTESPIEWVPGGNSGRALKLTAYLHRCTKIKNEYSHISTPPHPPPIYSDNFILPFIFSTLVVMLQHLMQFFEKRTSYDTEKNIQWIVKWQSDFKISAH